MARVQPVSLVSPLQIVLMVCTLAVFFFVPIMDAPLKESAKLRQEHCGLAVGMTSAGGNSNGAESEACGFRTAAASTLRRGAGLGTGLVPALCRGTRQRSSQERQLRRFRGHIRARIDCLLCLTRLDALKGASVRVGAFTGGRRSKSTTW